MPASFRNPVYAQVGMFLAVLVTVRLYYALIEANTATLYPWITSTNSRLITLHLLAIPAATLGGMAARKWLTKLTIIPVSLVCGSLVTLVYSSLSGAFIGLACGIYVQSLWLRTFLHYLIRPFISLWLPGLCAGALLGLISFRIRISTQENLPIAYLLPWLGIFALAILATWIVFTRAPCSAWGIKRPLILLGFMFALLLGLVTGPTVDHFYRIHRIGDAGSYWWQIPTWEEIPTHGICFVNGIELRDGSNDHIHQLRGFPHCTWLVIEDVEATPDTFASSLLPLQHLWHVRIRDAELGDSGLSALAHCPQLSSLTLERAGITQNGLKHLTGMTRLQHLTIDGIEGDTPDLTELVGSGSITALDLRNVMIDDDALMKLQGLRGLEKLIISDCPITGRGFTHLQTHQRLSSLVLIDCPIEDRYLTDLTKLPMNWVTLEGFPISDESIKVLGATNSLIGLSLRRTGLSDAQVQSLLASPIEHLTLDASQLTSNSRESLIGTDDVHLYVDDQEITAQDIKRLSQLEHDVTLHDCQFNRESLEALRDHQGKTIFHLLECKLSPAELKSIQSDSVRY